jgi:predicted RNase H-like HicB family nuclease
MMPEFRYEVIIYWRDGDQAFCRGPGTPGCAPDGATYAEAVSNVDIVVHEWLETA